MTEPNDQDLRQLHWKAHPTAEEQDRLRRYLDQHPEAAADWEAEAALTRALARLPDAPLASNFTARVLAAVDRQAAQSARSRFTFDWWGQWLGRLGPRLAWATALLVAGFVVWRQHELVQRSRLVAGLGPVLQASALPDPKLLEDFDAIQQLGQLPPPTDVELLSALSE